MEKNAKNAKYRERLSKVIQSIEDKLNYNRAHPPSKAYYEECMEDIAAATEEEEWDDEGLDDDDIDFSYEGEGDGSYSDGREAVEEREVSIPIKSRRSGRFSMVVMAPASPRTPRTPRTPRKSVAVVTPRGIDVIGNTGNTGNVGNVGNGGIGGIGGNVYVAKNTDVAEYGEFPEIKFLRPAGVDPEKMKEFLMSVKTMIGDDSESGN